MGFKISWLAACGISKADLLSRFGLSDTGVFDEVNEAQFSCAEMPTGWTILFSNDCEWANADRGALVSLIGPTLTCVLHEGIMWSEAAAYGGGEELWHVLYDSSESNMLDERGALPPEYFSIRDAAQREQEAPGALAGVDFIFDVPINLALAITGWRHDLCDFPWGTPFFTEAEPLDG